MLVVDLRATNVLVNAPIEADQGFVAFLNLDFIIQHNATSRR